MRYIWLFILFSGCSALNNPDGALQPVVYKNLKDQIYFTTCNGAVEDWGSCISKANKTCKSGFETLERLESPVGGKRELTFKCKS